MSDLVEKLRPVERDLAREFGDFALFALFAPEENSYERWDLVLAAPLLRHTYQRAQLQRIIDVMRQHLTIEDYIRVCRFILLPITSPALMEITRRYPTEGRVIEIFNREMFSHFMREGFIMTSRPVLACTPDAPALPSSDCTGPRAAARKRRPAVQVPELPRT